MKKYLIKYARVLMVKILKNICQSMVHIMRKD